MFYYIKTFGCQMNVHESEKLAGMLVSLGYEKTEDMRLADVIVFNTCSIRDGVDQKIMGNIGVTKRLKKQNPNLIVAVCGCMTQAKGASDNLKKKYPYLDIIFGTHNLHLFKEYLQKRLLDGKKIQEVWEKEGGIFESVEMLRDNVFSNAWVNINYGCNNFCSYCIVPYVRGRERSREPKDIVAEVKSLIADGYKYITLLGQNVNSYGNDFEDKSITFASLLKTLNELDGDFRLKFMTSHPKDLSDELIDVIANGEKISKCIHLPIQSGSNKVLKEMNRKYTREHYLELIQKIRARIPDAYISTDIIVGFPGETEEEFEETVDIVNKVRYDGVFAFMYSRRKGTVADKMENQIPEEIKKERIHKLLGITKAITKEKNKELVGKTFNVIAVKRNENMFETLTDSGKTVFVENENLEPNSFYSVRIKKFSSNKLYADLIEK